MTSGPTINHNGLRQEVLSDGRIWQIPLGIVRIPGVSAVREPVSCGVPIPKGCVLEAKAARLVNGEGASLPVQIKALCRWFDGSVQWALVDALLTEEFRDEAVLEILEEEQFGSCGEVVAERKSSGFAVRTGGAGFQMGSKSLRPFESVRFEENGGLCLKGSRLVLTDNKGRRHEAVTSGWAVETEGPIRASLSGWGSFPGLRDLRLRVRMNFFAESGLVKLEITLHNPHRARHRGGLWDLGDPGSILFRDLSLELSPESAKSDPQLHFSLDCPADWSSLVDLRTTDWSVYQDSSGGENWQSRNHVNRDGRVPCQFRGYRVRRGEEEFYGQRATPTISLQGDRGSISVAVPEFWQQFPKAISVDQDRIRIGIFPEEWDDLFEMQGGERKTHTLWLDFQSAGDSEENQASLAWVHRPAAIHPKTETCDHSGALPLLEIKKSNALGQLDDLLTEARDGAKGLIANRDAVDEYGWRNYGEVFADHEQAYYTDELPLISHYNNQFDMVYGFLFHSLRREDRTWWELGDALARHVIDIDIYHTQEDKPAYNGGLFWFTDHYLHAHTSTHRTYTRFNRPGNKDYGGGPGPEHNFTSGLLLHYCLTGNPASREAVITLADWVINMDDGRGTILGVLDDGPTGLASGSGVYQGPSRAGGNSINALLDAWRLTHAEKYIRFAEALIRRCVHPSDDIESLELLDVESRWSYTVFLTSLAKYLDLKSEAGQLDEGYAYAQASLLHYAKWILAHEKPYFDQVEKLEFPTEAWAVQEFRKANVLRQAAPHASEPLRSDLLKRGEELGDRAWQDLLRFPTRTYSRAVAIVMTEGYADCVFRTTEVKDAVQVPDKENFGRLQTFVPQKQRVKANFRTPRGFAQAGLRILNPLRWWNVLQTQKRLGTQER